MHDLIIIGAGPAGLSASIYACRAGLKVCLIEKFVPGGQAVTTAIVENYPGFESVSGPGLMEKMKQQAKNFGAEFIADEIRKIETVPNFSKFKLIGREGAYEADSIIVATGADNKKIGVPGEKKFTGKGVSYCATCDGPFFKNKEIAVIGGGNRAVEDAIYLTRFAKTVTIVHRRDRLRAQKFLVRRAKENQKIKFFLDTILIEINGKDTVERIKVKDLKNGTEKYHSCQGVFIFAGLSPNSNFIKTLVSMDEQGYIIANEDMATSTEGIFTAGDVRKKDLRQIITACSDGAIAAMASFKYISRLKGTAY